MLSKAKIAFVTTLQPETHYSRYLLSELRKQNEEEILIYTDKNPDNKKVPLKNIKLVFSQNFLYPFQILKEVKKDRPKIIHLQQEMNMYGGTLNSLFFPFLLFLLKIFGKKIVVTFHAVVPQSEIDKEFLETFSSYFPVFLVKNFFSYLYKFSGYLADFIIVHSKYMKEILEKDYKICPEKIWVIPIGIPSKKAYRISHIAYGKKPWSKYLQNKKIILYFGYILKRKGLEYLIEAFNSAISGKQQAVSDYVLVLAGGELFYQKDYAFKLKEKVKKQGLSEKIIFTGFISQSEMENLYQKAEFVVFPYTYSISSSLPLSFAWQFEKPIIATSIGSLKEEVEDQKDGILVKPKNIKELKKAIEKLIEDKKFYLKLKEGIREKIKERSWEKVAEKTKKIYDKLLVS